MALSFNMFCNEFRLDFQYSFIYFYNYNLDFEFLPNDGALNFKSANSAGETNMYSKYPLYLLHFKNKVESSENGSSKVIREKSRGEGSLIVQDTIENVSELKFFF